jgi:hypothetical protein
MVYSGARGKLIHEKKLKSKISRQTPFKMSRLVQLTIYREESPGISHQIVKKFNFFCLYLSCKLVVNDWQNYRPLFSD